MGVTQKLHLSVTNIVKEVMPDAGQSMIRGTLRARGIHVSTPRLRECISAVDPVNTALRWASPIHRRTYAVAAPASQPTPR